MTTPISQIRPLAKSHDYTYEPHLLVAPELQGEQHEAMGDEGDPVDPAEGPDLTPFPGGGKLGAFPDPDPDVLAKAFEGFEGGDKLRILHKDELDRILKEGP